MKQNKIIGKISILAGMSLLAGSVAGCAKTTDTLVVRAKGTDAIENCREEEGNEIDSLDSGDNLADSGNPEIDLYKVLGAPGTYQSEVSDTAGKLKVHTDAVVEIPEAAKVSAIYVSQHPFEQAEIERITRAFFDDADVYDAGTRETISPIDKSKR